MTQKGSLLYPFKIKGYFIHKTIIYLSTESHSFIELLFES